jgi:hypothetical protein
MFMSLLLEQTKLHRLCIPQGSLWPMHNKLEYPFHVSLHNIEQNYKHLQTKSGSAKSNRREPRSCLGQVLNIRLGSFVSKQNSCMACTLAASRVENSAQVSSYLLKFVHD